jgi:hypothetical protein
MQYAFDLKIHLAKKMAKIDSQSMGIDEQSAYEYHLACESFQLLEYFFSYFGVFDNPEENLLYTELNPNNF